MKYLIIIFMLFVFGCTMPTEEKEEPKKGGTLTVHNKLYSYVTYRSFTIKVYIEGEYKGSILYGCTKKFTVTTDDWYRLDVYSDPDGYWCYTSFKVTGGGELTCAVDYYGIHQTN